MERQPGSPKVAETDQFYLWIALRLAKLWDESPWLRNLEDEVRRDVVLAVTGYYQDVVADGGLWRSFTRLHSERFGSPLPHYGLGEDYIDLVLSATGETIRVPFYRPLDVELSLEGQDVNTTASNRDKSSFLI